MDISSAFRTIAQTYLQLPEVTSTRTFGNNKSEHFRDEYDSVYLHRSCLRDGCYTTNVQVNNDTCYCVSRSCNQGEAVLDHIGLSQILRGQIQNIIMEGFHQKLIEVMLDFGLYVLWFWGLNQQMIRGSNIS